MVLPPAPVRDPAGSLERRVQPITVPPCGADAWRVRKIPKTRPLRKQDIGVRNPILGTYFGT